MTFSVKSNWVAVCCFLLSAALNGQVLLPAYPDSLFNTYYHQRVSLFRELPTATDDILFVGNSITDGGEWTEQFQDMRIKNRGISGDYTVGVIHRLPDLVKGKPAKIFLMIGVNDLSRGISTDSILKSVLLMADYIHEQLPSTRLYLQSVLPVNPELKKFPGHTNKFSQIVVLNQLLKENAASHQYQFIELHSYFVNEKGYLSTKFTNDGLHLTGQGYILWKHLVYPYVYGLQERPSLLPLPQQVKWKEGFFTLKDCKQIVVSKSGLDNELRELLEIFNKIGHRPAVRQTPEPGENYVELKLTDHSVAGNSVESYQISISEGIVEISASSPHGIFNGLQTFRQLLREPAMADACEITDWPAFSWRGFMVDVGRNYVSVPKLKELIAHMAMYKYSVFHFHATEDIAWRFAVEKYPQLVQSASMLRNKGKFYSEQEIRELIRFCKQKHIKFVPEIDMPGHSAAFRRTFNTDMQSQEGLQKVRDILTEICDKYAVDYIHIGADEVKITDTSFLPTVTRLLEQRGKKVIGWQPGGNHTPNTIRQLWMGRGLPARQTSIQMIDSRHLYLNHMDPFESVITLFNRRIGDRDLEDSNMMGATLCLWNDRAINDEEDLFRMNPVYPGLLAFSERSWLGGGQSAWVANLSDGDTTAFNQFEQRMLEQRQCFLQSVYFPYVQQRQIVWKLIGPFKNNGEVQQSFEPESSNWTGNTTQYAKTVSGATVILRHWWAPLIKGAIADPRDSTTWYASARFWSNDSGDMKCWIGFNNISRSYTTNTPVSEKWDERGSKIWVNGKLVGAPAWRFAGRKGALEEPLYDEGYEFRDPSIIPVKQGWNEVLVKLPVASLKSNDGQNPVKWMFSFAPLIPVLFE